MIRFTTFDRDPETSARSVSDIIEICEVGDPKATRRIIMRHVGALVDKMLSGDWGVDSITIDRDKSNPLLGGE
jgi:hypothetical protein